MDLRIASPHLEYKIFVELKFRFTVVYSYAALFFI